MDGLQQRWFDRLMRHSTVCTVKGCYLYHGPRTVMGYGKISVRVPGRKNPVGRSTHVIAFNMFVRTIRAGFEVSHKCHVPNCWNPAHLREEKHTTNCKWREQRRKGG